MVSRRTKMDVGFSPVAQEAIFQGLDGLSQTWQSRFFLSFETRGAVERSRVLFITVGRRERHVQTLHRRCPNIYKASQASNETQLYLRRNLESASMQPSKEKEISRGRVSSQTRW